MRVPYHLKIDTGMGRLGTRAAPDEIARAVAAAPAPLEGLMTHFASSGNYESKQTEEQLQRFEACDRGLAPRRHHAALRALLRPPFRSPIAAARPGAIWCGRVTPSTDTFLPRAARPPRALDVAPALTWKATVLAVKDVEAGALIGYGGIHRAARPMRIAVLAAGYADGIPHRLGNRGQVIVKGKLAPIVGAVSMDLTTIDVTGCPGSEGRRCGDAAGLRRRRFDQRPADGASGRERFPTRCCAGFTPGSSEFISIKTNRPAYRLPIPRPHF